MLRHAQASMGALGRFLQSPLTAFMSLAVVAVAVALPALLYVLLENTERLLGTWEDAGTLSVYLKPSVSDDAARAVGRQIEKHPAVTGVRVVGRSEGLAEFRRVSGFAEAIDALGENPLPAVIIVRAKPAGADATKALAEELGKLPEAELAQMDAEWVQRFHAMTGLAQRGVLILGALLAIGTLFIIGNTIRLEIRDRREEIEITALVGGTAAFIRRPFLYFGVWLGLMGGLLGWLISTTAILLLDGPVSQLAALYHSGFELSGGGFTLFVLLAGGSTLLGLCGAWLAVARQLEVAQPD
jgi:cell division transport system permease protein